MGETYAVPCGFLNTRCRDFIPRRTVTPSPFRLRFKGGEE